MDDLATAAPSQLLAAGNRVIPFGNREREINDLLAWRDSDSNASIQLMHAAGGQGKTRLADEFFTLSRQSNWNALAARHISDGARQDGSGQSGLSPENPILIVVDYADRWPIKDLLRLTAESLATSTEKIRILMVSRSAEWWPPMRHELLRQGWQTSQWRLTGIESEIDNRRLIHDQATSRFADILCTKDSVRGDLDIDIDLSGPQYELVLSIHMAALASVLSEINGAPAPAGIAATSAYLLDRERAYWRRLIEADQVRCQATTLGRSLFDAVLAGPLPYDEAARLLELTGVSSTLEPTNIVLDDQRKCYPPREPSMVLQPLYPDRLAEDFVALQIPGLVDNHEADPWSEFALGNLIDRAGDLRPEIAQRFLFVLVEVGRRWPHVADRFVFKSFEANPSLALLLGGAGLLRLITTDNIDGTLLANIDAALPAERTLEFDSPRAIIGHKLLFDRLAQTKDPFLQARIIAQLGSRFGDAGDQEEALRRMREAAIYLQDNANPEDERYLPAIAAHLIDLSGAFMKLERFQEGRVEAARSIEIYRGLEQRAPGIFSDPLAAALNNFGMASLQLGDTEDAARTLEEVVRIREGLARKSTTKFSSMLAASLDNLSLVYAELGRDADSLELALRAVEIFRKSMRPNQTDLEAELAAALDNLGGRLWAVGKRDEAIAAIGESVEHFGRLSSVNPSAFEADLLKAQVNLAQKLWDMERRQESLELYKDAISIRWRLSERYPALYLHEFPMHLIKLGLRLMEVEDFAVAKKYLLQFLAFYDRGVNKTDSDSTQDKAFVLDQLSICYDELSDDDAALAASLDSVAAWERIDTLKEKNSIDLAIALRHLALRLNNKHRFQEAVEAARKSITALRAQQLDDRNLVFELAVSLGVYAMACEAGKIEIETALEASDESAYLLHNLRDDGDSKMAHYALAAFVTKVGLLELAGRREEANELADQLTPALGNDWRAQQARSTRM